MSSDAWGQAQHVFLAGNDLPARWQNRDRFVILETGFGGGHNFLATWAAWLADRQRCRQLFFVSIEKHPLTPADLRRLHAGISEPSHQALIDQLEHAWPPLTPGLHTIHFEGMTLMLAFGDVHDLMPNLTVSADAFYLDGLVPHQNPQIGDARWLSRLNRLAAPDATAASWCVAPCVSQALQKAGFNSKETQGFQGNGQVLQAAYQPHHAHVPLPGGLWPTPAKAHQTVLVVGGGLAGCASAWALTHAGWHVTLIEQHEQVATEASGNPGGMFHSILHATDNVHTRAHRAAALYTANVVRPWMAQGLVQGQCEGLLRLAQQMSDEQAQALLEDFPGLQAHVAWLDQAVAQQRCQVPVPTGGWWFKQGGWLNPADYARALLQSAQHTGKLKRVMGQPVNALSVCPHTGLWQALDVQGQCMAQASSAVLCNAHGVQALLRASGLASSQQPSPLQKIRGQISQINLKHPALADMHPPLHLPKHPLAGEGYGMQTTDGHLIIGATAQLDDEDAAVRQADTTHHLKQAMGLGLLPANAMAQLPTDAIQGRTAWRASALDRLPLIGAWPHLAAASSATGHEQLRRVARLRTDQGGLYVFSGLGSRGIAWAALGARLLTHWMTGSPCPVETDLRDAMDPARFQVRQFRHRSKHAPDLQASER
jgi:tRNA 5-methylaminomethyl-2-thiouridine biosynthesis bifunctional protein